MVSLNRDTLSDKVLEGERISSDEAIELYSLPLEELGALADARRNLAKEKKLRRTRTRDRNLHRRPEH